MVDQSLILIFQKPELYFFPHYKDIVFAPYERREKTPLYYLYRCMNLLKLPFSSFFWGEWKKHISIAKRVIIFDYGYQNCMEKYIKKANPNCEVLLFCWNKIDKYHNNHSKFTDKTKIYSTDKGDCEKYNLKNQLKSNSGFENAGEFLNTPAFIVLQSKRERPCFQTWDESLNLYCRFVAFVSSFVYNNTNER